MPSTTANVGVPPHDLDAERSVLGALLIDPGAIVRVVEFLRSRHFYRKANEDIYEAIRNENTVASESNGLLVAYIGVDGQNLGQRGTSFVQCVALHKYDDCASGKGGRVFYVRHVERRYKSRNQRLLREAELAVKLAQKLEPLFTELEKPTTAAVILNLRQRGELSQNKIEGLTYFIAAAVPGLEPMNVTILDTEGNSLTKPYLDETAMISGTQLEFKMQVDRYLANKAKSLLDAFGNSVVTVNTELDWDRIERTTTAYDQESSALVSEERITETTPSPDGPGELEESTINYETGQIVENFVKNPGDISRLTVSVYVDWHDSTWVDGEGVTQVIKVPWSENQIATMRTITENAVGFNSARGDLIEVEQIEFGVAQVLIEEGGLTLRATIVEGIRALSIGIAIIGAVAIFFFMLRSVVSSLDPSKISMKAEREFKKQRMEEEEELPESERDALVRRIVKTSMEDPETVAKTLKTFFKEE